MTAQWGFPAGSHIGAQAMDSKRPLQDWTDERLERALSYYRKLLPLVTAKQWILTITAEMTEREAK